MRLGVGNYSVGKSSLPLVFVNKVLLTHAAAPIGLYTVYGYFCNTIATGTTWLPKPKIFISGP